MMSEKRFSNLEIVKNLIMLDDNDKFTVFTEKTLCNLLNSLVDENEQLKKENENLKQQVILAQKGRNVYMKALLER